MQQDGRAFPDWGPDWGQVCKQARIGGQVCKPTRPGVRSANGRVTVPGLAPPAVEAWHPEVSFCRP